MIGVGGLARAGKDTLSRCLKKVIQDDFGCEVEIVHLADKLKSDLDNLISDNFHFGAFTEENSEKELIRPILVAYGEAKKSQWGKTVWMRRLEEEIKNKNTKKFFIVSDVRFDFECRYIRDNFDGWNIHIKKNGSEMAVNETEKENDPLVQKEADIKHRWPAYHPDKMHLCEDHATIMWDMIPSEYKDKWRKILNL